MPLVLLLSVYISVLLLHHVYDEFLVPQAELMRWTEDRKTNEMTYYDRSCTVKDMSTNSTDDLLISSRTTPTQCMHHMAKHGVSLYPNILQEETADELREWIVQHNKMEEGFYVISGKHRFTFGIGVNQAPIVTQALKEIAEHPVFRPAIEEICGANPAVIEFTAITRYVRASHFQCHVLYIMLMTWCAAIIRVQWHRFVVDHIVEEEHAELQPPDSVRHFLLGSNIVLACLSFEIYSLILTYSSHTHALPFFHQ
jgi:hypothetical protein